MKEDNIPRKKIKKESVYTYSFSREKIDPGSNTGQPRYRDPRPFYDQKATPAVPYGGERISHLGRDLGAAYPPPQLVNLTRPIRRPVPVSEVGPDSPAGLPSETLRPCSRCDGRGLPSTVPLRHRRA